MAESKNVATGKPLVGGAIYRGSESATLPTTTGGTTTGFTSVGYITEDGYTRSKAAESSEVKAWGGDTIDSTNKGTVYTYKFAMAECMNVEALKVYHGDDNVVGTSADSLTVKGNSKEMPTRPWIIDEILKGTHLKRTVIPAGKVTAFDDVTDNDGSIIALGVTITAFPDASGNSFYEYYSKKTS